MHVSQAEMPELILATDKHYVQLLRDDMNFIWVFKVTALLAKPRPPDFPPPLSGVTRRERRYAYCVSRHGPTGRREAASGDTVVFTCTPSRLCVFRQVESWWMGATGRRVRNSRRFCEATGGHMQASESVFGCLSLSF